MADAWRQEVNASRWETAKPAPREFALPAVVSASPVGWQKIGKYSTGRGVAYMLNRAGSAMLFVVRLSQPDLPTAPPERPQLITFGKTLGSSRNGGLIYVLVVPDEGSYRRYVPQPRGPLA